MFKGKFSIKNNAGKKIVVIDKILIRNYSNLTIFIGNYSINRLFYLI